MIQRYAGLYVAALALLASAVLLVGVFWVLVAAVCVLSALVPRRFSKARLRMRRRP